MKIYLKAWCERACQNISGKAVNACCTEKKKGLKYFFNSVWLFICKAYDFLSTGNGNFIISNYGEVLDSSWLLLFHGQIFWSLFIPPNKTCFSEFEWSLLLKSRNKAFCKTCRRKSIISVYFKCFSSSFLSLKLQMILHINPEMSLCCFWFSRALLEHVRFKSVFMVLLLLLHILLAWWCYLRRYLKWRMEWQSFTCSQNWI